jgi:SAM-dependent methyltransferase
MTDPTNPTNPTNPREVAKRARRAALGPVMNRVDAVRLEQLRLADTVDALAATVEQQGAAIARLDAYLDTAVDTVRTEAEHLRGLSDAIASILTELGVAGAPRSAGQALRDNIDHALRETQEASAQLRRDLGSQIGEVRSGVRLTQSLVERVLATPAGAGGDDAAPVSPVGAPTVATDTPAPASAAFEHPVPTFDLLYRAFEDRHRGSLEEISRRQREDYLDLLLALPHPELAIADLGCGRGELVRLLTEHGANAVGVDTNAGQVADDDQQLLIEDDLFRWLDRQPDGSLRAVTSAHVVEHLPTDLQIRLVFEAYRVLAPGGALVLETPNALSMSTAATNFWVDPTHQRPVHPLFLEFLAHEAGFAETDGLPLHPVSLAFRTSGAEPQLVDDLNSLIFGHGDLAFVAHR